MTLAMHAFTELPKAVLLDLDNTLYAYAPPHLLAMQAVANKCRHELAIEQADFDRVFEEARLLVKKRLGKTASAHSRLLYFQQFFENLGMGSQPQLSLQFEQTYWRTFIDRIVLFRGVRELLDDLRLLGIPAVLVTDLTSSIQLRKLVALGIDGQFRHVVTSEESGSDKPSPAGFILAKERLRLDEVPIWMIGDDLDADIAGARRALGALTLQKVHEGIRTGNGDSAADLEFSDFEDVRKLLSELGSASG